MGFNHGIQFHGIQWKRKSNHAWRKSNLPRDLPNLNNLLPRGERLTHPRKAGPGVESVVLELRDRQAARIIQPEFLVEIGEGARVVVFARDLSAVAREFVEFADLFFLSTLETLRERSLHLLFQ